MKHRAALTVLTAAHTPSAGRELTRRRLESLLGRCDRRNDPRLVEQILTELKAPTLRQPPQVEAALGQAVLGPLCIIASMHQAVDGLEEELGRTNEVAQRVAIRPSSAPIVEAPKCPVV
ncbi:hypothetical protein ACFWDA_20830 [Rhodococcus zopfii]|uniref:hypothetical protein n=1 Tax=Rhodococcus zopfii TaxID=43772 RepID=UPI003655E775